MPDQGSLDASATFPGAGYYSGIHSVPSASSIASGTTILGVSGSAKVEFYQQMNSNALRSGGAPTVPNYVGPDSSLAITLEDETRTYAGSGATPDLPNAPGTLYREVPDETQDDEGYLGTNAIYSTRPSVDCGTSGSVGARIADCATKNPSLSDPVSTWGGASYGNSGEGTWKLVSRDGANKEVWMDLRTNLLWSSKVAAGINWCQAAGVTTNNLVTFSQAYNTAAGTPMTGNGKISAISGGDSSWPETLTITFTNATTLGITSSAGAVPGSCVTGGSWVGALGGVGTSTTYTRAGVCSFTITAGATPFAAGDKFILKSVYGPTLSCTAGAAAALQPASPISYCAEAAGLNPGGAETWAPGGYVSAKGGMGAQATDKVRWRLPTIHDYEQAELNGIRMVMPDMGASGSNRPVPDGSIGGGTEWAANVVSSSRDSSWAYVSDNGRVTNSGRGNGYIVRCVGR